MNLSCQIDTPLFLEPESSDDDECGFPWDCDFPYDDLGNYGEDDE